MKKKKDTSRKKEKQKFVRNLINLLFIAFFILSSIGYTIFMFHRIDSQYDIRLQETGNNLAKNVHEQIRLAVNYVEGMAECFSNYEDIHCEEALDTLTRVDKKNYFTRMWLTKMNGQAVSSEGKTSDATGRTYLGRAKNGESGISEVQYSRVNGEKNVVVFAPTYHEGKATGMVIGILRLNNLFDIINVESFNGEGRCIIYTDSGDIIAQSGNWDNTSARKLKYGYSAKTGIMDWNVFVTFPDSVIAGEIKANMIITVVMCLIWAAVLGVIIFNTLHARGLELKKKAQQDSLTELMNRGAIEAEVEAELSREKSQESAFIIFDVDKFKLVNDTVGHILGDNLLREIARLMEQDFGAFDCLGRLGGDEFGVFIREVKDKEELYKRLGIFQHKVKEIPIGDKKSTVSIGVAFTCGGEDSFDSLYQKADRAMYESKSKGGDRVTVYRQTED